MQRPSKNVFKKETSGKQNEIDRNCRANAEPSKNMYVEPLMPELCLPLIFEI